MKKINILYTAIGAMLTMSSCNNFLDKLPDDRAELNTEAKITSMMVSAYATHSPALIMEYCSDNETDNGPLYDSYKSQEEAYHWKDITNEGNDDPKNVWQSNYGAVAAANQALQAIAEMGNPASLNPQRGEALMCRAWAIFRLANMFCLSYNPQTADKDLGLPYPIAPETQVTVKYERGTLAELYKKINDDIETALPLIDDNIYTVPKYHFNRKAAYAFAARFNLFYMQYDKTIEYANEVLGANTTINQLRNFVPYMALGYEDCGNSWIQASEPANLMMQTAYSLAGRMLCGANYTRYGHNRDINNYETYRPTGPWGAGGYDLLYYGSHMFAPSSGNNVYFPNQTEQWEVTDKVNNTGYAHIVEVPFTTEETLLCRAEAYTMKKEYEKALVDLNLWQQSHCYPARNSFTLKTLTLDYLKTFYDAIKYTPVPVTITKERTIKKTLNPQGFTVEPGDQENLIQCILFYRRIDLVKTGMRFVDIKRYGIAFSHAVSGSDPIVFAAGDLRGAIQLPSDVITAGLTANPR